MSLSVIYIYIYIYMFAAKLSIIFSMQLIIKLCVLYYADGFVG